MNSSEVIKHFHTQLKFDIKLKSILKAVLETWDQESACKYSIQECQVDYCVITSWSMSSGDTLRVELLHEEDFEEEEARDSFIIPIQYFDLELESIAKLELEKAKKWLEAMNEVTLNRLRNDADYLGYELVKKDTTS